MKARAGLDLAPAVRDPRGVSTPQAGIFALRDDAKNAYLASIAKASGIPFTIAIAHEAISVPAFEQAGIDVSVNPRGVTAETTLQATIREREREALVGALDAMDWNFARAAQRLGISRMTLYRRLSKLGIARASRAP